MFFNTGYKVIAHNTDFSTYSIKYYVHVFIKYMQPIKLPHSTYWLKYPELSMFLTLDSPPPNYCSFSFVKLLGCEIDKTYALFFFFLKSTHTVY